MRRRPSLKSPCVADRYHGAGERIAEFSFPSGRGGLIAFRTLPDGTDHVELYRLDEGVSVVASKLDERVVVTHVSISAVPR